VHQGIPLFLRLWNVFLLRQFRACRDKGVAHERVDLSHRLDRCDHGNPLSLGPALGVSEKDDPMVWGLATLLAALIGLATAQSLTRLGAPSGGQAESPTSVGGENLIAYDLDRLFRAERRPNADLDYPRSESARILLTASSHSGI
jgi:hypothetical protein